MCAVSLTSYVTQRSTYLPHAQKTHKEVIREPVAQHLRENKHVTRECALEHDRHIRRVKELDRIAPALSTEPIALHRNLDAETLEVDDRGKYETGGDEVHDVRKTVAIEGFLERTALVVPREEKVEERDNGAFEFGAATGVDGGGAKGFPDDGFADVGSDEKRNTRSETVPFLEELVKKDYYESGRDKLKDEKQTDARADVGGLTV